MSQHVSCILFGQSLLFPDEMVHRIANSKIACYFLNIASEKYVILKTRGPADFISVISKYFILQVTVYVLNLSAGLHIQRERRDGRKRQPP